MEKGTRKRRKKEGKGRKGWTKDEGGLRRSSPLSDSSLKTGLVERCGLRSKEESEERHSPVISLTHKLLAIPCLCWSQLGNVLPSLPLTSFPFPLFFSHLHSSLLHFFLETDIETTVVYLENLYLFGNQRPIANPCLTKIFFAHLAWDRDYIRHEPATSNLGLASSRSDNRR